MQVSIALVQSLEELLQTAVTRLSAEIKAETNPQRIDTLLTLAFRARLPRIPTPPRTSPVPQPARAFGSERAREPGPCETERSEVEPEAKQPRASLWFAPPSAVGKTDSPPSSREIGRANGAEHRASEGAAAQSRKINSPVCKTVSSPEPETTQPGLQDRDQHPSPRPFSRDSSLVPHTSSPLPSPPDAADEDDLSDNDEPAPANEPLPHYLTPMTDDEFAKLQREIGFTEANRRRLIRAHLASKHRQRTTDSS